METEIVKGTGYLNRFYILNSFDLPSEWMIAELEGGHFRYLARDSESHPLIPKESAPNATPLEAFGIVFDVDEDGIWGRRVNSSTATHPDGKAREWRGNPIFLILKRESNADTKDKYELFGKLMWEFILGLGNDFCDSNFGPSILKLAKEAGLCEQVPYDPEIHGDVIELKAGDSILWWKGRKKFPQLVKRLTVDGMGTQTLVPVKLCSWGDFRLMVHRPAAPYLLKFVCSHEPSGRHIAGGDTEASALASAIRYLEAQPADVIGGIFSQATVINPRGGEPKL